MTRLVDSWQLIFPKVQVDARSVTGVADLEGAQSHESTGLLVLGRPHGVGWIAGLGQSLARAVIEHADCPVAVVPPHYGGRSAGY